MTEGDKETKSLGALLQESGLITENQLQSALAQKQKKGSRLGYWLVRLGFLPIEKLQDFLTANKKIGHVGADVAAMQKAFQAIPRSIAFYYKIAPIQLNGNVLTVGLSEYTHEPLVDLLAEITGHQLDALILPEQEVRDRINNGYRLPAEHGLEFSRTEENTFVVSDGRTGIKPLTQSQLKNVPDIGERLRSMIAEAIKEKFREILLKPEADHTTVYFKKDSLKLSEFQLSPAQQDDMMFLIFSLAKMNHLQQKSPQHGGFAVRINDRKVRMVVSAIPGIYGTRFYLEMFDEKILQHSFDEVLKPFPEIRQHIEDFLLNAKKGVLAITGPDGSGRTQFLYSLLSKAKHAFHNIHTLENSLRYPINGIHQKEVSEAHMERALEEYLQQTTDLLAVSVLRTVRSVELAFLLAAKMPVVIVLPSYDSYKAVEWLCGHNLKSPIKAGLLHTILSPRMIPRICPHCSVPYSAESDPFADLNLPAGTQLRMNQGCDHCRQNENLKSETFFEAFRIDNEALEWILRDPSSSHLRRSARSAGRQTLYDVVVRDAFSDHFDMLSVAKLQAAL